MPADRLTARSVVRAAARSRPPRALTERAAAADSLQRGAASAKSRPSFPRGGAGGGRAPPPLSERQAPARSAHTVRHR
ncbi:hypothetical protein GCM10009834_30610 [Streptomonospora arabica]